MPYTPLRSILGFSMLCLATAGFAAAGPPQAKVTDLAWMSGHWEGAVGTKGTFLEEHWAPPKAGTIASLVRNTKGNATTVMELIVIEEAEGSLVLHMQQWGPGYTPRPEGVLVMKLAEFGENRVMFEAVGDSLIKTLGYRREGARFIISGTSAQGPFEVSLTDNSSSADR